LNDRKEHLPLPVCHGLFREPSNHDRKSVLIVGRTALRFRVCRSARDAGNENAYGVATADGFAFADDIAAHTWDGADAGCQSFAWFEVSNAGHGDE
jgi:hypothetical protein